MQAGAAFGGRDETDSFSFSAAYAAAGSGGPGGMRGELAAPDAHGRDTTHNITNDIPGLSVYGCARQQLTPTHNPRTSTPAARTPRARNTHTHTPLQACPRWWRRMRSSTATAQRQAALTEVGQAGSCALGRGAACAWCQARSNAQHTHS